MKQSLHRLLRPSLATLFFRYYLSALFVLVLVISAVGVVIDQLYAEVDEKYACRFMRGTVQILTQELQSQPETNWPAHLSKLATGFSYPITLIRFDRLQGLNNRQQHDIQNGIMRFDENRHLLYQRVGESQLVLTLGPLNFATPNNNVLLADGTHTKVLWWSLTGLGFGLLVFLLLRPLWNDLVAIRHTAEKLAGGELSARAPRAKSWLLTPLPAALNTMAERLEGQINAQQTLSHIVSHELRTPIARLRFGLTMLEEAESQEEREKYCEGMKHDMVELDDLVNASMSYAQLGRGQIILQPESIELADWFGDLLARLQPLTPPAITLELVCQPANAEFDHKLMYIATRNLLVNALRFANSLVRLHIEKQDNWLSITVDDDGPGVPEDERERIFEPFHRLDNNRVRNSNNYGLGLSFVWLIAEKLHGSVFVTDSPQGGACFVFNIPTTDTTNES